MKQSQAQYVEKILLEYGRITRNECLQQFISRLGSIINILNSQGWTITGKYIKTKSGKDYEYTAEKVPYKQVTYTISGTNTQIKRFQKV